jgi:hypothetical protein
MQIPNALRWPYLDCEEALHPEPPEDPRVLEQLLQGILSNGMSEEDCNKVHLEIWLYLSYDALQLSEKNGCECRNFFADQIHGQTNIYREASGQPHRGIWSSHDSARIDAASTPVL